MEPDVGRAAVGKMCGWSYIPPYYWKRVAFSTPVVFCQASKCKPKQIWCTVWNQEDTCFEVLFSICLLLPGALLDYEHLSLIAADSGHYTPMSVQFYQCITASTVGLFIVIWSVLTSSTGKEKSQHNENLLYSILLFCLYKDGSYHVGWATRLLTIKVLVCTSVCSNFSWWM